MSWPDCLLSPARDRLRAILPSVVQNSMAAALRSKDLSRLQPQIGCEMVVTYIARGITIFDKALSQAANHV